jgi:hypothetical protein
MHGNHANHPHVSDVENTNDKTKPVGMKLVQNEENKPEKMSWVPEK